MSELLTRAKEIKNATEIGENTAERVGGVMVDMVESIMLMRSVMGGNAQVIEWSHTHNMNDYKDAGTYRIKGERTGSPMDDNLPIMNSGSGHTIEGILYVLDSSLTNGSGYSDHCTITQFLMLSNRVGGQEGDMYMRSAYGATKDSLTWKPWEKYQTNMEVGVVSNDATHDPSTFNPINANGLNSFVDNGIYSGVYLTQEALSGDSTKAQTFVMVVINNYVIADSNKTITQIKFAVATNGTYSQEYRTLGTDGSWSEWNNEMAAVTIVNDLTTGGADKALSAEMGKELAKEATTSRKGLMTANDKLKLNNISSFVSLIPTPKYLPNIDTINKTLDFGSDAVLFIGKKRYVLKQLHADADAYRKILIYDPNVSTSAIKIIFNEETYKIEAKSYLYVLSDSECVIGYIRLVQGTTNFDSANFPFKFTIDGVNIEKDAVGTFVQTLTETQKTQARENIGASDAAITDSFVKTTTSFDGFTLNRTSVKRIRYYITNESPYLRIHVLQIPDGYNYSITVGTLVGGDGVVTGGFDSSWKSIPAIYNLSEYAKECRYIGIALRKKGDAEITEEDFAVLLEGFKFEMSTISLNTLKGEVGSSLKGKTNLTFIAHRGVHVNDIPENSLDAYRYAGYCGFEYAETDFCPTADDELVLMHDASINRTMRNKYDYSELTETVNVRDKTLAELRENYVLTSSDVRMRREIPTLEEFFVTCKNSGVFPIPEIKTSGTTNDHVRKAHELGKKIMGEGNFGFCSFSPVLLDYARSLSEKTLLLYINNGILGTTNSVTGETRESNNTWWYPSYNGYGLTKEVVRQYKEAGMKVAVWTTPVSKFDDLLKMEVDCLAGDFLSPNIAGMYGFVAKSEVDFSKFETNGVVENKTIKLSKGQTLKYSAQNTWLGGYYISVIGKGAFTITAPNLSVSVNLEKTDRLIYQGLVNNQQSRVTIQAKADSVIEFVDFCSVNF